MLFFLPLVFLIFCAVIIRRHFDQWRAAVLYAAIITATVLTALTESLSFTRSFSFYPLLISWSLLTIPAGLQVFRLGGKMFDYPCVDLKVWTLGEKTILGMIILILGSTAITAAFGVPNTWDSMTYHLPRVAHWIQNKTVGFYPTNISRQLYSTPWAEFAIAHVRILGGGETSANFIQWLAMAGSLIGVSLIAGQLGAGRLGQLTAALMAACLPAGILQSVNTQTDYTCAWWLIVFVFFLIEAQRAFSWGHIVAAGLSLGLAFLTKGNSYIFAIPFLVWFLVTNLKLRSARGLMALLLIFVCATGLNSGQYLRSQHTFKTPMDASAYLMNSSFDLKVLWVNILRNIGLHLATPLVGVNEGTTHFITKAARLIGADINDPRATLGGDFIVTSINLDEDYSGNLFHLLLFTVALILFCFSRGPKARIGWYIGGVLSSYLLFCSIMRYQPWNSRFHLPLFILFCPVAGIIFTRFLGQKSIVLCISLFLGVTPWLFLNHQHPWFGPMSIWKQPRAGQYFYKRPLLAWPVVETASYLRSVDCRQIGLLTGEDSWEYPWWVFLGGKGVRIEHVNVSNPSASLKYPLGDFQACAIIVSGMPAPPYIMAGNALYAPAGSIPAGNDKIAIFIRKF